MNNKTIKIAILVFTIISIGFCIYILSGIYKTNDPFLQNHLPFYGPKGDSSGKFTVPDFAFQDQNGDTIRLSNYEGKVWVTDFFFTTCEGICPIMETNMKGVLDSFANNSEVLFLSHTVQPEVDSIPTLKAFSKQYGDVDQRWHFVTGSKMDLYRQAREAYFIAEPTGDVIEEDFVHSQLFALIDQKARIRGYYDGTKKEDIEKLVRDIHSLLK